MDDSVSLMLAVLFGSIGLGFFLYGKRQARMVPLGTGVALMVLPYLIGNTTVLTIVGLALIVLPYFLRM